MPANAGYIEKVVKRSPLKQKYLMEITKEQLQEITEVIEDTVEYFCDLHTASGQLAWTVVETLATAKLAEMRGELNAVIK